MGLAEDFRKWITEPDRTNDELYTAELLVESGWKLCCSRKGVFEPWDWEAIHAHSKARLLNPAYRAVLQPEKLDALVEVWAELRNFTGGGYNERPLGEIETLRFFPHLTSVSIHGDFVRIDALAGLRDLATLSIHSSRLADVEALRGLPALKNLTLTLSTPWPELAAMDSLTALETLHFQGNLLAWRGVAVLPSVIEAEFKVDFSWKTPLRSMRELPAMPAVRRLQVDGVDDLAGVERYAACNLQLEGSFRSLEPLASHRTITWLRLQGREFTDLKPLARMPALRELVIRRELPIDLSPLAEAPALRQVWVEDCKLLATELAAINAFLVPWAEDFLLPPPPVLPPMRFIAKSHEPRDAKPRKPDKQEAGPRSEFYGEDRAYASAEDRWFQHEVNRRLDRLLGRAWRGKEQIASHWILHSRPGQLHVHLKRPQDAPMLREVAESLHELVTRARFPWSVMLIVGPPDPMDRDEDDDDEDDEATVERDRQDRLDYLKRQREQDAFIERQHRLTLLREQGLPIDPKDFAPPPSDVDNVYEDEPEDDGIIGRETVYAELDRVALWVNLDQAELAAEYYGAAPENWHDLQEPPEERPAPPF